jgi:hypothetical protein
VAGAGRRRESGDDWQQRGLKADAVALLRRVRAGKRIPIDRAQATAATRGSSGGCSRTPATEHTASGRPRALPRNLGGLGGQGGGRRARPGRRRRAGRAHAPVRAWIGENAASGILPWPMLA